MEAGRFLVWTREDCALCDAFIAELADLLPRFEVRDVESDPQALRRFGQRIPVLTCDGRFVCQGRLDREAVLRLVRAP